MHLGKYIVDKNYIITIQVLLKGQHNCPQYAVHVDISILLDVLSCCCTTKSKVYQSCLSIVLGLITT